MEDFGILEAGSIIVIEPTYGRGRNEFHEIVSFDKEYNTDFNQYLAYKINADRDKVIGAKDIVRFPKTKDYLSKGKYNYHYWIYKKGNGNLVISKDSQKLLDLLNATQGDEKDIKHLKEMIQVTKDLINLI